MTNSFPEPNQPAIAKPTAQATPEPQRLNYQDTYICPVCRHGQISSLALMDAFACNFCRHIFSANLREQSVQVVDSSQPQTWRWNGRKWQLTHQDELNLTVVIWLVGIALIILPPLLVWLSSYTFPPLEGSTWSWFPRVWVGLALVSHLSFVGWLLAEHYQVPLYIAAKVKLQQWLGRY